MGHLIHSRITEYRDSRPITEYTPEPFQSTSQPRVKEEMMSCHVVVYILSVYMWLHNFNAVTFR